MNLRTNTINKHDKQKCLKLAAVRSYLPKDPIVSDKLRIINDLYEYIYTAYKQVLYVK